MKIRREGKERRRKGMKGEGREGREKSKQEGKQIFGRLDEDKKERNGREGRE